MRWPFLLLGLLAPATASADPCEGRLPSRPGETFAGIVRYVGDGDGLCVGTSRDPATWIEVRLADFDAPELDRPGGHQARRRLSDLALGRPVRCVAQRGRSGRVVSYDRVVATCRLGDRPLSALLRQASGRDGGD